MTPEEIEREFSHLATREQLAQLEVSLLKQIIASERAQRLWIWGLYGLVIVLHAATWAGALSLILPHLKP